MYLYKECRKREITGCPSQPVYKKKKKKDQKKKK